MLTVESSSVRRLCSDALHKILHSDSCDKTRRHCLYGALTSPAAAPTRLAENSNPQQYSSPVRNQQTSSQYQTLVYLA